MCVVNVKSVRRSSKESIVLLISLLGLGPYGLGVCGKGGMLLGGPDGIKAGRIDGRNDGLFFCLR